jgi:thermitase
VAGIAAAITNNGIGVAGVSWGARIMPVKVLDASGADSIANESAVIV